MPQHIRTNGRAGRPARRLAIAACVLALAAGAALTASRVFSAQRSPTAATPVREDFARSAARAVAHGEREQAETLARARGADNPEAAAVLARLWIARGRYDEAEGLLRPARNASPRGEAAFELAVLLQTLGRKDEARKILHEVTSGSASDAAAAVRMGKAEQALGRAHEANDWFLEAIAASPSDPAAYVARGELVLERHDADGEAPGLFQEALKRDEVWAPAHLGLARAIVDENPPAAIAAARRALEIDPGLLDAHLFLADAALDADRTDDARQAIDKALAINPRSPAAHALAAALAHVQGQAADAEKAVAAALGVNPSFGDAYRVPAAVVAANGRFEEALPLARRAVALEPDSTPALADLGLHLLRSGEEAEARQVLERAFKADSFNPITFNLLQMLDTLDTFSTLPVGNARLRVDPKEAPVLQVYARPIIEEAMARYRAKYRFEPRGPILVEIFPRHDHFAVRTLGIPGLLGALGACFGRVVTQDSPRAREPNTFNWQATLWHELAHVFTLQLSNYRVPRWLSEGISVYEEGRVRPEWAADSEMTFVEVYSNGRLPKLADFNAAFTRPDLVSAAYFQASLVVTLLAERHGEDVLRRLVAGYADGATTEDALRQATGAGLDALQAAFDEFVRQRYAAAAAALKAPAGVQIPKSAPREALLDLASRHPGSFQVQMAVGRMLAASGAREEAIAAYERAVKLVPFARGDASPRARMAALAADAGDAARALQELETLVRQDHTNADAARQLAALAEKSGNEPLRAFAYERIVTVDPFDAPAHTAFGRIALGRRDATIAVREFQAALAAGAVDRVAAHCDLAEALLLGGRRDDARREVLAALEIAPTYERAQELLLKISG